MNNLPNGWVTCTLGDVCTKPQYGWTTRASRTGDIKFVRTTDISNRQIDWLEVPYCEEAPNDLEKYRIRKNDILVSRAGSVGVSYRVDEAPFDAVFASYLIRFKPLDTVLPKYLDFYLRSESYWRFISESSAGIAVPNVNASKLSALKIPLPPLNEQRRIVAKVEEMLGKLEACQKRLARIPVILKRFRQSVLAAACSGQLTAEWRDSQSILGDADGFLKGINGEFEAMQPNALGLQDLPQGWVVARFGAVVSSIRGGSTAVPKNEPTQFPILRSSSVRRGSVDLEDVKFLSEDESKNELNYLADGDLLFTRLSGSLDYVANCAKVKTLNGRRIQYPDRLFCAKALEPMGASYCELAFSSAFVRDAITEHAKSSAGHQRVSIGDITAQPIPIPPPEEQQEIVRRVDALFKFADQIEARYKKAQAQVDKLTQSILSKAFRGELVPTEAELARREGRDYETASVLLERIRGGRSDEAPALPTTKANRFQDRRLSKGAGRKK